MSETLSQEYYVNIILPEGAPFTVLDMIIDKALNILEGLEESYPDLDFYVEGTPADHTTEAALDRALEEIAYLKVCLAKPGVQ